MKKITKQIFSCAMAAAAAFSVTACGKKDDSNKNKAWLYVYSFTSGFGKEWFTSLIADYEKEKENDVIGDKKGIHIVPTAIKSDVSGTQILSDNKVLYFLEQQDYYQLLAGKYIGDITDAVTTVNPYDGKTLESKMFDDQKSYFARQEDGETHYYAYPHYFTSFGIIYDVGLFDEKGYYFVQGYDPTAGVDTMFLGAEGVAKKWPKTAGPDGEEGTSDDGLPTTYQEFFWLCDYIAQYGGKDEPLLWSGQHRNAYLTHFINALATDYNGYEQTRLNFTFDGEATNLGTAVNGEFVPDAKTTKIDGTNGAELARQAGKFYAMDFYNTLFKKSYIQELFKDKDTIYDGNYGHKKAQEDFLEGMEDGGRYAMLLDGSWWQMEASKTFKAMSKYGAQYSKQNRTVGWMPLPKQSADLVGGENAVYDIMYPLLLMKNGLDKNSWEYKYAIDFIQFANSDEQLAKFTQITGCTKALKYDLTKPQYDALSYYGKTFYDAYKNEKTKIVFPFDNNLLYADNQSVFKEIDNTGAGSPLYKSTAYSTYYTEYLEVNGSLTKYFNGMYDYFKELTVWKKSK